MDLKNSGVYFNGLKRLSLWAANGGLRSTLLASTFQGLIVVIMINSRTKRNRFGVFEFRVHVLLKGAVMHLPLTP